MGSAEFYEKVSELQNIIHKSEDRRMNLDIQLRCNLNKNADHDRTKLSRLEAHWKTICENEKRSTERNEQLLRDIDRVEGHLAQLSSRTEKLKILKKQYEDYIERAYPKWRMEMEKWLKHNNKSSGVADISITSPSSTSATSEDKRKHDVRRGVLRTSARSPSPTIRDSRRRKPQNERIEEKTTSPSRGHQLPFSTYSMGSSGGDIPSLHLSQLHSTTQHSLSPGHLISTSETSAASTDRQSSPHGVSTDRQSSPHGVSTDRQTSPPSSSLKGTIKRREDVSFEEDKISGGQPAATTGRSEFTVVTRRPEETDTIRDSIDSLQPSHPVITSLALSNLDSIESASLLGSADLSLHGLVRLLDLLDTDIISSKRKKPHSIYTMSPRGDSVVQDIIKEANSQSGSLSHLNTASVSGVIIDQLFLINAGLPQGALIPDALIRDAVETTNLSSQIEIIDSHLPESKKSLWNRLLRHLRTLVERKVMTAQDVADKFAACIIHPNSRLEDKMILLLKSLLNNDSFALAPRPDDSMTDETESSDLRSPPRGLMLNSMMATAGSFHELNSTSNPDFKMTKGDTLIKESDIIESCDQVGSGRSSEDGNEEVEDMDESTEKPLSLTKSHERRHNSDSESDGLLGTSVSMESQVMYNLKDSAAYQQLIQSSLPPSQVTKDPGLESEEEELDEMMTSNIYQPSGPSKTQPSPAKRDLKSPDQKSSDRSDKSLSLADRIKANREAQNQLRSTQELLKSVTAPDSDLEDDSVEIESPGKKTPRQETKKPSNDDDFFDFYN